MANPLHLQIQLGPVVDKIRAPFKYLTRHTNDLVSKLKGTQQASADISGYQKLRLQMRTVTSEAEKMRAKLKPLMQAENDQRNALKALNQERNRTLRQVNQYAKKLERCKAPNEALQQQYMQHKISLTKLEASYRISQSRLHSHTQETKEAVQQSKALDQQQKHLKNHLEKTEKTLARAGIRIDQIATHQRTFRREIKQTTGALERQNKIIAIGERIKGTGRALKQGIGKGWNEGQQIRQRFNDHIAPALAPGLEFDSTMSRVQALTGLDKDSQAMQALRTDARAKGASTSFSAVEVAQGQAFLAQAGFKADQIIASTQAMLDVARAGDVEVARAADIASNISSAFGIDPADSAAMTQLADQLVAGFTSANMSLEDLGETMKYFAPIAKAAGIDTATSVAMTGMLGNVGIQGSEAGTALRTMATRLAALPSDALKELGALKINTKDDQGNLRNMAEILADLDSALKGRGSADKLESLKKIFGQEALSSMQTLTDAIGQGGFAQQLDNIRNSQGAASKVAGTMADNLSGDLNQLHSATLDLGLGVFEAISPLLRALSQAITPVLQGFGQWMQANPALAKTLAIVGAALAVVVTVFGALTMTLGVGAATFTHAYPALMLLKTGLLALGRALMANPIGLAITAIGLAAYLIYQHWQPISEFFRCMWEVIKGYALSAFNGLKTLLSWTPQGLIMSNWSVIADFMRVLWDGIWLHIKTVWELIAGIFTLDGARILDGLSGLWELINGVLMGWPEKFQQFGIDLLQGFISGIKNMAGSVGKVLTTVVGGAVDKFKNFLGINSPSRLFADFGQGTMQGYSAGLEQQQDEPVQAVLAMGQRLRKAAAGIVLGTAIASAPVMANTAQMSGQGTRNTPPTIHYEIHIHAAPGQDAQAIATAVRAELDRRESQRQARQRSALNDD